jgi:hypothetical protein
LKGGLTSFELSLGQYPFTPNIPLRILTEESEGRGETSRGDLSMFATQGLHGPRYLIEFTDIGTH